MERRHFLKQSTLTGAALLSGSWGLESLANATSIENLVVLHTNDVHSRLDPFPMDGSRNQGLGGVAARIDIIQKIRKENEHVLLLDAGDIFQGTPYFNIYKGEPEIKAMQAMGYDACTIGNHDFDAGLDNFVDQLSKHANFPCIICNYDFTNTPMEGKNLPYKVFKKGTLTIGVLGVGIELQGLVPANLYGNTRYLDPISSANATAAVLKQKKKCDLIICLSHLGYKYQEQDKVSDLIFAANTENIDVVIGGHTHTFLEAPTVVTNKQNRQVLVNQVGFAGIQLGRLDFTFNPIKKQHLHKSHTVTIGKNPNN